MYKRILVGIALDHEHNDNPAFDIARQLAGKDAEIIALNVLEEIPAYATSQIPEEFLINRKAEAQTELKAELGGISDVKPVVISGHAGRSIVDYAKTHDVDCIVISSHRPGLQDYFLGSTAQRVVRHATCAVHILR